MDNFDTEKKKTTLFSLYENCPPCSSKIVFCGEETFDILSYNDMHNYVNEIAIFLEFLSISKSYVCCLIKQHTCLPSVLLGILKTSSAFAFLDVQKPIESLITFQKYLPVKNLFVDDCWIKKLIPNLCSCWKVMNKICLNKNTFVVLQSNGCVNNLCPNSSSRENCERQTEIAYVIQTSGTTGEPKVVRVPHGCIAPNIIDFRFRFKMTPDDVILQLAALSFDVSIVDIFLAILTGASLIFVSDHLKSIPKLLTDVIIQNKVTFLQITRSKLLNFGETTLKNVLLHHDSPLRILALGAEVCPSMDQFRKWKSSENKTEIYNLYGLTEVSSWATCYKLDFNPSKNLTRVPIGEPLLNTKVDICYKAGFSDRGELLVGGERFCLVNNEDWPTQNLFMRRTGDIVSGSFENLVYFEGRLDDVVNLGGYRIPLHLINIFLETIPKIENFFVHFDNIDRIFYIFIIWTSVSCTYLELEDELKDNIRKSFPKLPAVIVLSLISIPLTKHGKCDVKKLMTFAKENRLNIKGLDSAQCEEFISISWKKYTNRKIIHDTDKFILTGGDSFSAIQFAVDVERKFQIPVSLLIQLILNETFGDVNVAIKKYVLDNRENFSQHDETHLSQAEVTYRDTAKRKYNSECFIVSCKQGYFERCFCAENLRCFIKPTSKTNAFLDLELSLIFKWNLKRCVDATPCILHFPVQDQYFIFIGSHFGQFSCFDLNKMQEVWHVLVPDRIESSACISACGKFVLFGCYDHHLYCLHVKNGSVCWKFQTNAEIKSSPSVSYNNVVFVGSHDKHVYAINIENGCFLWKKQIASGSIFSSPALIEEIQAVCAATLDGFLALLKMESGDVLWKYNSGKVFFSSPVIISNSILIGSTNNSMLCFDLSGKVKFTYETNGPVFSSAAVCKESNNYIIFGCHDNNVYCLTSNGTLHWKVCCDSFIYSTPCVFKWDEEDYICVTSSKGVLYIIQQNNGKIKYSLKLEGEIFSSPVIVNTVLAVGCRDDNLYCFNLKNNIN